METHPRGYRTFCNPRGPSNPPGWSSGCSLQRSPVWWLRSLRFPAGDIGFELSLLVCFE